MVWDEEVVVLKGIQNTDLKIEVRIRLAPARAFELITKPEHLIAWWGPEGITIGEHQLDFTSIGPLSLVMTEPEVGWHCVSGEVLAVSDVEAVEISWAWHDWQMGERGHKSRVRLADAESARLHHERWASSFGRISALITPTGPIS